MDKKLKILIVEDEEAIRQGLIDVFVFHGYDVDFAVDGRDGLQKALHNRFDLILLDVMLPELDGFSVCNEIRKVSREQPIILLTAKTSDDDIITGLTLGADDYVAKPFSVRELVLRVEAVLRRTRKLLDESSEFLWGPLTIDVLNLVGSLEGGEASIAFTRREIEILQYLKDHQNRPVTRDELLSEVWGYSKSGNIETRTVDIHIAKLRRKIEANPKNPKLLVTVRGEGYRLET
ncbi:MAG: response regulator transcription factor [Bdellovibrionota bacterium]